MPRRAWLFLPALLVWPLCALAADNQRQLPVYLSADRIEINQKKELSLYRGHVLFKQGTLQLTADRATVQNRANLLESVMAEGKPVNFRYRPEASKEFIEGESGRAVYNAVTRQVDLYENVQLRRGRDLFRSAALHYDIESQRLIGQGAPGNRVYTALLPKARNSLLPEKHP